MAAGNYFLGRQNNFMVKLASANADEKTILERLGLVKSRSSAVQLFDENFVVSRNHLIGAYVNALIAFKNGSNRTGSLALEMLLFAAMTEQIGDALRIAGLKGGGNFIIFSSNVSIPSKLGELVSLHEDFRPSLAEMRDRAVSLGINAKNMKSAEIDEALLQKIALARLTSD